jgi:hypothetical protein
MNGTEVAVLPTFRVLAVSIFKTKICYNAARVKGESLLFVFGETAYLVHVSTAPAAHPYT